MKMLLMKFCSLLVIALGVLLLVWALGLTPITEPLWMYYGQLMANESVPPIVVQVLVAAVLLVLGLIAFLPGGNPRSLRRAVVIPTEHGQVAVQLDALRPVLLKVLRRMPEVRKVKLSIKPPRGKKKAMVTAFVSLRQQAKLDLRQHVDLITQHIAETAVKLLGIENLVDIEVFVDGIKVDAKAAAREVLASAGQFETRLLAQTAPAVPGVLGYDAAAVGASAMAELPAKADEMEEEQADEYASEAEELYEEADIEAEEEEGAAESKEVDYASGDDFVPAFIESENAPPLPPIDPDNHSTPSDATVNNYDSDPEYVLPPMNEQEVPLNLAEADISSALDPADIFSGENAIPLPHEEVEGAHADAEESADPLGDAMQEDEDVTRIPAQQGTPFEALSVETEAIPEAVEIHVGDDEPVEDASPGMSLADVEDVPAPPELPAEPDSEAPVPPRKRWSFF